MEKNQLGQSDLVISRVGLGTMTWGEQNSAQQAFDQMDWAIEQGINFFDAAEMYPVPPKAETYGATETILGNWLKARKMQGRVVVATKAVGRGEHVQHIRGGNVGLKSESLMQACEQSLVRLGVECIDLYQVHWPDRPTNYFGQLGYKIPQQPRDEGAPIHETLEALTRLIGQGKVRAVGISNETPWGTMRYLDLARELGLTRIVTIQNPYNLLNRTFEVGLAEICHRESLGLLAYSPLAFGVLSGKYRGGVKPEGSRLALYSRFTRYTNPQADAAVEAYAALASESGYSMTQLALSFVYSRPFVVSSLIGGATVAQLQENLEASMLMLPKEILKKLDEIHQRHPNPCP